MYPPVGELIQHESFFLTKRRDWKAVLPKSLGPAVSHTIRNPECDPECVLISANPIYDDEETDSRAITTDIRSTFAVTPKVGVVLNCPVVPGVGNVIVGVWLAARKYDFASQVFLFSATTSSSGAETSVQELNDFEISKIRNTGGVGSPIIYSLSQETLFLAALQPYRLTHVCIITSVVCGDVESFLSDLKHGTKESKSPKISIVPIDLTDWAEDKLFDVPLGFDTVSQSVSEMVGAIATDVATCQDRFHLISSSTKSFRNANIITECVLQVRPNLILPKMSLMKRVYLIADFVSDRRAIGKRFGIVILADFHETFAADVTDFFADVSPPASAFRQSWPEDIHHRLLNCPALPIPRAVLLIKLVRCELLRRASTSKTIHEVDEQAITAHVVNHQRISGLPSDYDATYGNALGWTAGVLMFESTDPECIVASLSTNQSCVLDWTAGGVSLRKWKRQLHSLHEQKEDRLCKFLNLYSRQVNEWRSQEFYRNPGPLQYSIGEADTLTLPLILGRFSPEYLLPRGLRVKSFFPRLTDMMSPLQIKRLTFRCKLPSLLVNPKVKAEPIEHSLATITTDEERFVRSALPLQCRQSNLYVAHLVQLPTFVAPWHQRIGVVLAGQPSPGVSNVLFGLYERSAINSSRVIGFLGVQGLFTQDHVVLRREELNDYVNAAGFELLGSSSESRNRLKTEEGIACVAKTCTDMELDGLVFIGGRTTFTAAAMLTEHFLSNDIATKIVCVPANHENNVKDVLLECMIGFDSHCHAYAAKIGALSSSMNSARSEKHWFFVRIEGKSPTPVMIEVALRTHVDMILLAEEYEQQSSLSPMAKIGSLVSDIMRVIKNCQSQQKNFGVILVPTDLILRVICSAQTNPNTPCPDELKDALCNEDFPVEHAVCQLVSAAVSRESGPAVSLQHTQYGFGGRSTIPSNFDCALATAHGYLAGMLVESNLNGYATSIRDLCKEVADWRPAAVPLALFMRRTSSQGPPEVEVRLPRVTKTDLGYLALLQHAPLWRRGLLYCNPGPMQFDDSCPANARPLVLQLERSGSIRLVDEIKRRCRKIVHACAYGGVSDETLNSALLSLRKVEEISWFRSS